MLRGENASAKSLHSVVQTLESDKVKLELKVKNLELQLKENKRQLGSSSGTRMPCGAPPHTTLLPSPSSASSRASPSRGALPVCAQLPCPHLSQHLAKGLVTSVLGVVISCYVIVTTRIRRDMTATIIRANHEALKCRASRGTEIALVGDAGLQP